MACFGVFLPLLRSGRGGSGMGWDGRGGKEDGMGWDGMGQVGVLIIR